MPPFEAVRLAFVPPFAKAIFVPFHTPVVIVPKVVMDDCPTYEAEMSIIGVLPPVEVVLFNTPETLVTVPDVAGAAQDGIPAASVKTKPFEVAANLDKVFAAEAYRISPVV